MESTMFEQLTKLPAPSSAPPAAASGTVVLYNDPNWKGATTLSISDYPEGFRHTIPSSAYDRTTWIAFNLPVGTVMTLTDHLAPVAAGQSATDLRDCGVAVDLVGTGTTVAVDLPALGANDKLSSFLWREVDPNVGAVELFADPNFKGARATLFLSEWSTDEVHPLSSWWLQDRISSIRWASLDRQEVQLFEHSNGGGIPLQTVAGYVSIKEIANLKDIRFDDKMSSFRWRPVNPKKEIIDLFSFQPPAGSDDTWFSTKQVVENNSPAELAREVTFEFSKEEEISITTTDTFSSGVTASVSHEFGPEVSHTTVSVEVSFSYEHSTEQTKTFSKSLTLSTTETLVAPAYSTVTAYLTARISELDATEFKTTAQRWYEHPVRGSVKDPANNNWYKRVEDVTLIVQGGLASEIQSHVDAVAMPGHESSEPRRPRLLRASGAALSP